MLDFIFGFIIWSILFWLGVPFWVLPVFLVVGIIYGILDSTRDYPE